MLDRPKSHLRESADGFAAFTATDEGKKIWAQFLHLFRSAPLEQAPGANGLISWQNVQGTGIWSETDDPNILRRDLSQSVQWRDWANVHEISRKKRGSRAVLLGESVARGYFYDPVYNPAGVLRQILQASEPNASWDIIDVAKTDLRLRELRRLCHEIRFLENDVMIVFAGNNWFTEIPDLFSKNETEELKAASIWEAESRQRLEERLWINVEGLLRDLRAIRQDTGFRVLLVLPEFNLRGWRCCGRELWTPLLPDGRSAMWSAALDSARLELANGQYEDALRSAERMLNLDGGGHPLSHEVLGDALWATGRFEEASRHYRSARDAATVLVGTTKPRLSETIYSRILHSEYAETLELIDLRRELCESETHGPDPGLFLDYCHLSARGMSLAMKACAESILRKPLAYGFEILRPDAATEATALFWAAVHNAHYGQPDWIVADYCRRAGEASSSIAKLMALYVDFATRSSTSYFCRSFQRLRSSEAAAHYGNGLMHPPKAKTMDVELVDTMATVLLPNNPGIASQIEEIRIQEHEIGEEPLDLLQPAYSRSTYDRDPNIQRCFVRCYGPRQNLLFVSGASRPVLLQLVYRNLGQHAFGDTATLLVNGTVVSELPPSRDWRVCPIDLPATMVRYGLNQIEIRWPVPILPERFDSSSTSGDPFVESNDTAFLAYADIWSLTVKIASL